MRPYVTVTLSYKFTYSCRIEHQGRFCDLTNPNPNRKLNSNLSDEVLLDRYFAGDPEAIRLFIARHSGRVVAYAESKGLRPEIAVEVAQESFLKLHRFIHKYQTGRPALPWFFAIVHRCVIDVYRAPNQIEDTRTQEFFESIEAESSESTQPKSDESGADKVEAMLGVLTNDQRIVVKSRALDELTFKEISGVTGKSEVSLRKVYERAKSVLVDQFGEKIKKAENHGNK